MQGKHVISLSSDFEDAIERAQIPLFGYLIRLTGSVPDAQDILQMTNVTAWTRKDAFEPGSDLVAWMRTIAINHARNEARRRDRQGTVPLLDDDLIEIAEARHALRQAESPHASDSAGRRAQLNQCVEKLSPSQQTLVKQFYHQGLSLEQIATATQSKANAIGQRLHRVRTSLIQCVQRSQETAETHTSLIPR